MSATHAFTHLFVGSTCTIAIGGPWIHVLKSTTGMLVDSKQAPSLGTRIPFIQNAACFDTFGVLVTITSDKVLCTWVVQPDFRLELKSTREVPKKASCVLLDTLDARSSSDITILIGDKFGDVFFYPFDLPPDLPIERDSDGAAPAGRSSLAAHTNKHGQLLLGHVSILTSIALAHTVDPHSGQRRRYIITSDRDEHIRVSRYPQAHIIEQFCLGSKSFVTALHICSAQSGGELRALVSGGGENQIRFWDWLSGHCLGSAEIGNVVTPFIKIRRKVRASEGDDQEGEAAPAAEALEGNALDETEAQIAVQQIESFVLDGELCIIFSVVGGTALFQISAQRTGGGRELPDAAKASSTSSLSVLGATTASMDLIDPVLSFSVAHKSAENCVEIYVSLDSPDLSRPLVRRLVYRGSRLIEEETTSFLDTLNKDCARPVEGDSPDYYEMLSLLPKSAAEERGYIQPPLRADDPGRRSGDKQAKREKLRNAIARVEQQAAQKRDEAAERTGKKSKTEG